jgi:hypothetical protein
MKQTAVEWLVEEMFNQGYLNDKPLTVNNIEYFVKQAKEMERQQIIQSHEDAYLDCGFEYSASDCANDYYNKKFKL